MTAGPEHTPVVIYAAKSSPDPHDSVASQIERIRARLEHESGRVERAEPFSEENVSGYRRSRGPQLAAAIEAAKAAAAEHGHAELWVFHSSRLGRGSGRMREARALGEVFYDLRRHGVSLRSVEDDPYVTDEAFVGMASKMANKYSEDLAAHVRRGKRGQFERGERLGGPVCDGYRLVTEVGEGGALARRYVLDDERAPIIRRMAALALEGRGDGAVARQLNVEGLRTKAGKGFTRRRVQHTLTNPFYAGRAFIHKGTARHEERAGSWPTLIDPADFDLIRAMRASRDRAAVNPNARCGRRATTYALAKLAACDRCGARMYCVTSPYKRKDGTRQRSYECANVRDSTGLCDQPRIDARAVDTAIVAHLERLFIDFDAWLGELAKGSADQRAAVEAALTRAREEVADLADVEQKLRRRYVEVTKNKEGTEHVVETTIDQVVAEKVACEREVHALEKQLALEPPDAPTDAMLDIYNDLARAVRGGEGETVAQLNDRLRASFDEFRIDRVDDAVVGILPILRADLVKRYTGTPQVMADDDTAIEVDDLAPESPAVLWAGGGADPPPIKPLEVAFGNGAGSHE